ARNPHTRAFPPENPQVYELYWSPAQVRARSHPNLLAAQRFLLSFWHSRDPDARLSTRHPVVYADRLRMRAPGDQRFALGCHVDGGSCERWEEAGYGKGRVYEAIFRGDWESYDPWESSCRLPVTSDLYHGIGACSMFRMAQGWLAMSETHPFEGTLLVNPLLRHATAYFLLRPFFTPKKPPQNPDNHADDPDFLHPDNWSLEPTPTSWLQGATPGRGQELHPTLHPHLHLHLPSAQHHTARRPTSMTHIPPVRPGDYVAWHCDSIHAVDARHAGTTDSSVLYIPSCPLTEANARFLARQREAFLDGTPCPDFGGGEGESRHLGRPGVEMVEAMGGEEALRAWGLRGWDGRAEGLGSGERGVLGAANEILGFA
ncbi:Isopenicillin N synthase-like, partial [Teratosphaeria destructans]